MNILFVLCVLRASPAEHCPVESGSVQLVNSTQAVHWFDLPIFFKEVDRILCPGGVLAVSGYFNPVLIHPTESENFEKALQKVSASLSKYSFPRALFVNFEF